MSILSALKQQNSSIDDLAKLPQAAIMQMVQHKQIGEEMLAPILSRKAEMADAIARQNALQNAGQTPPTVVEQLVAKNAQAEHPMPEQMPQQMAQAPEETGVGQLPIPNRAYAGGGIIAFADGGLSDDEEDDRTEMAMAKHAASRMDDLVSGIKKVPSKISSFIDNIPKSYEATKTEISNMIMPKSGNHQYEEMALAEAKRQGVDPKLALHVLYKETGGHKDPANAKSHAGAVGPMQIMPKTAKELGIDPHDPVQNIYGGIKYLAQLGPMFGNDPRLTAAAYNAGPGNVRKYGGVPNFKETQNYVRGLAEGGEVKHYAAGDVVEGNYNPYALEGDIGASAQDYDKTDYGIQTAIRNELMGIKPTTPPKKAGTNKGQPSIDKNAVMDQYLNEFLANQKPPTQPVTSPQKAAEESYFDKMMAQSQEERKRINESAKEDKNLALLAAGLGMMGGTSPYAFANIGQGGLQGIQALAASKTRRAAELTALNKGEATQAYYGEMAKDRQERGAMNKANQLRDDFRTREQDIRAMVTKMAAGNPRISSLPPDQQQAMIDKQIRDALAKDPQYTTLGKQLGYPTMSYNEGPQNIKFNTIGKS